MTPCKRIDEIVSHIMLRSDSQPLVDMNKTSTVVVSAALNVNVRTIYTTLECSPGRQDQFVSKGGSGIMMLEPRDGLAYIRLSGCCRGTHYASRKDRLRVSVEQELQDGIWKSMVWGQIWFRYCQQCKFKHI
jgi:hypothetical protein